MSITSKVKSLLIKTFQRPKKHIPSLKPPKSGMDKETVLKKITEVPFWWHCIELGHGVVTPGQQDTGRILRSLRLPEDMTGKSVLDIGAWDGFYSFEVEKRGAAKVLAIDNFYRLEKEGKRLDSGKKGFEIAKEVLASNVQYKTMDVLDISADTVGTFDIVLFIGVIYHLRHPLLALERIASITKKMMIIESHCENKYRDQPVAIFCRSDELNKDPTNWWSMNQACIEAMVYSAGFARVECIYQAKRRIVLHAFK